MKKIIKLYLCLLVSTQVFADVWVSNNTWNDSWEKKFAEWVKDDVSRDIFLQGKYAIKTDCADAAYSLRAIFAYENKLPFVIRNPNKYRSTYSNRTNKFDRYSSKNNRRFKKFLRWLHGVTNSRTMRNDTYSPELTRENIHPGNPFVKVSKIYFLKSIDQEGTLIFNHSRSPRLKRRLFINPGLPPIYQRDMKAPFGGFRKWRNAKILHYSTSRLRKANLYSGNQYDLYQKNLLESEIKKIFHQDLLNLDQLTLHINEILRERVEVIQSSYKIAIRSKEKLPRIYQWAYSFKEKDQYLLLKLHELKKRSPKEFNEILEQKIKINKTDSILVKNFYLNLIKGRISYNLKSPISKRWGVTRK